MSAQYFKNYKFFVKENVTQRLIFLQKMNSIAQTTMLQDVQIIKTLIFANCFHLCAGLAYPSGGVCGTTPCDRPTAPEARVRVSGERSPVHSLLLFPTLLYFKKGSF